MTNTAVHWPVSVPRPVRLSGALLCAGFVLACPIAGVAADPSDSGRETESAVYDGLLAGREHQGRGGLPRRAELDTVAGRRARQIASLPANRRLAAEGSIEQLLREGGVPRVRTATERVELRHGDPDPAQSILGGWRETERAWSRALAPEWDALGLATAQAPDGWLVFVAVFVDDLEPTPTRSVDLREMEREVASAVDVRRRSRGRSVLQHDPRLAQVARAHSEDMARRGYFDHSSPEGKGVRDRVERQGIAFVWLAENIHMSRGVDDPVELALRSWMESVGHRQNLLDSRAEATGVGIAVAEDGAIYFTQLFAAFGSP